jgi:hypothetical protein
LNFLQICQMAARETQMIERGLPTTTVDQVGILGDIVDWVNDNYKTLQLERPMWRWMRRQFTATSTTTVGRSRLSATTAGITSFSRWVKDYVLSDGSLYRPMSIYLASLGVSDEVPLTFIDYEVYRLRYLRSTVVNNRPIEWTIDPQTGDMLLGSPADDAYQIKGECVAGPEVLSGDDAVPSLPTDHHELLAWMTVTSAAEADNATSDAAQRAARKTSGFGRILDREQNQGFTIGGEPIA